ncbi:MAG: rhodanese-like domain-containing protein [Bacteroidota bacterium]
MDISVQELKERIDNGTEPVMIDVRNPDEWERQHLPQVKKVSLPTFSAPEVQEEIKAYGDQEVVFICRSGGRSGQATRFATQQLGLKNARNMTGGMLAWKEHIDPTFDVS